MSDYQRISEQLDDVADAREEGRRKMDWAAQHMPILEHVRDEFTADRPFEGERIGMAMHVEAKTAMLVETLAEGGAEVAITGCNPLSTHDDVSAALDSHENITSYAKRGVDDEGYYAAIEAVIGHEPTITVDDGMDLVAAIHEDYPELIETIIGGAEETTTGVHRLRSMDDDGALEYPVFAVNDTPMKRLFDNVHGTGESSLASIAMTTNLSWAGKNVVVAGYGYCGKGVAKKAAGQNANVIVTEVEPRRALEAHMEGYEVMPMAEAAEVGDVFLTTTGNRDVIVDEHFEKMQDGVLLANAGHFDIEIDLEALAERSVDHYEARDGVDAYEMADGRRLNVIAQGRLVNLAAPVSLGHPVEVMDQSFGVQAACVRELVDNGDQYDPGVHDVPDELDTEIAEIKLEAEGVEFDSLTETQREYMDSWDQGT
ncbi:adenosylhomocysteinase [Natrialba asiatica]|uniref:Adenosylhomocysteinase n=1 Tax=Natrialba asiatica (strain ATCC 700177 / DSM 12278 / JCM 9576 / FERM P-10747 / NBRC 102637 / 172P1) TaxID=29540 RepID=M0AKD0_NATA1|nr:adenosylhomocysteinase [Natrialba asiatica]ELY97848.1 S-adenosyl-L-homocysteine hydrolase [Natrialba asiatica DSM 12278]